MHDVLRFWLRRGVDGFRIDVVYRIAKDPALGENEPGRRHDQDWPTIHAAPAGHPARARGVRQRSDVGGGALPPDAGRPRPLRELGRRAAPGPQLPLPRAAVDCGRVPRHRSRSSTRPARARRVAGVVPEQPRPLARRHALRPARGRGSPRVAAHAARHAVPVPGRGARAADVPIAPEQVVDVDGRDPERAPIPWEPPSRAGAGAGFTTGKPWLPMDPGRRAASTPPRRRADPRSVLNLYRALLALRRARAGPAGRRAALPRRRRCRRARLRARRAPPRPALNFAPAPRAHRPARPARVVAEHAPRPRPAPSASRCAATRGS